MHEVIEHAVMTLSYLARKMSKRTSYGVIGHSQENFVRVIGVPN